MAGCRTPSGADQARQTVVISSHSAERIVARKGLRLEDVSVRFGGTLALDRLSMEVAPGQVFGLIGPNGAGKSTTIDAITGFVKTSSGNIFLGDENMGGWTPERRARAGLARSFQSLELFDDLSVEENVLAASDSRDRRAYLTDLFHPGDLRLDGLAGDAVSDFGLEGRLTSQAGAPQLRPTSPIGRCPRGRRGRVCPAARRASGRVGSR